MKYFFFISLYFSLFLSLFFSAYQATRKYLSYFLFSKVKIVNSREDIEHGLICQTGFVH